MNSIYVRSLVTEEISAARALLKKSLHNEAMQHLRRAHVLGQRLVGPHVLVHWWMFRVAVARRNTRAAVGQVVRIILGVLVSAVGILPTGNTGDSEVGMFRKMPLPPELARLVNGAIDV